MDTPKPDHVLIVDDDTELRSLLSEYLRKNGFETTAVPDGRGMRNFLEHKRADLIVLDVMLPGDDGLTLCRELRAHSNVPIIMLTAREESTDRIIGLEMGADDYLPKPYNPRELLARIKSVLRRYRALPGEAVREPEGRFLSFAGWRLDTTHRHLVDNQDVVVALSGGEYRLLKVFLSHPNRVLNRDQLLEFTQGREADPFDRSIDVQVSRLRQRLRDDAKEPAILKTVRGEGYVLAAKVTAQE